METKIENIKYKQKKKTGKTEPDISDTGRPMNRLPSSEESYYLSNR